MSLLIILHCTAPNPLLHWYSFHDFGYAMSYSRIGLVQVGMRMGSELAGWLAGVWMHGCLDVTYVHTSGGGVGVRSVHEWRDR